MLFICISYQTYKIDQVFYAQSHTKQVRTGLIVHLIFIDLVYKIALFCKC